jgi:branched-chain amino acid transport system ATP-binding protein
MSMAAHAEPILTVEHLSVSYGEAIALNDVSFELQPGSCLAIIGPNGAGKTTLASAITGFLKPRGGRVVFDGVDVATVPPHALPRRGLVYIPEGGGIFTGLTVGDNVRMGLRRVEGKRERREAEESGYRQFPALSSRTRQRAGSLSGGEQRMLALTHVLSAPPRLLIADEPSLGLAPIVVHEVYRRLEAARQAGVSMILIEQFVQKVLEFSDHAIVLQQGAVRWAGPAKEAYAVLQDGYVSTGEALADVIGHDRSASPSPR